MNKFEILLEEKYRSTHELNKAPDWAVDIEPAIPFVGNNYGKKSVKCLILGSAENLTHVDGNNQITANNYLRNRQVEAGNGYFKSIHMTPVSNGSLLTASRFVLAKCGYDDDFSADPKVFIEEVATVNFGKYTYASDTNKDYASTLKFLKESFELVKIDLEILNPDIIIMPKSIHDFLTVRRELFNDDKIVVPIYQTNSQVINRNLRDVSVSDSINKYPFVSDWLRNTISRMDRYLSWLDSQI